MSYRFPTSDLLVSQFRTENQINVFNTFVLMVKKWEFGIDILKHIEGYMLYDESIHTCNYAIQHNLPEVMKYLIFAKLSDPHFIYYLLLKCAKVAKLEMFKTLYEYTGLIDNSIKYFDMLNVDDLTIDNADRVTLLNDKLLKNAVQSGNLPIISYLIEDKNINIARESRLLPYYTGDPMEIDAVMFRQYKTCLYLTKKGANVELIFELTNVLGTSYILETMDPTVFYNI